MTTISPTTPLVRFLGWQHVALSLALLALSSRKSFLQQSLIVPSWCQGLLPDGSQHQQEPPPLLLPMSLSLTFLKTAGCLALPLEFIAPSSPSRSVFRYAAVVDTGSPFLTAPPAVAPFVQGASHRYPPTEEQYGDVVGRVVWKRGQLQFFRDDPADPPRRGGGPAASAASGDFPNSRALSHPPDNNQKFWRPTISTSKMYVAIVPEVVMRETSGLFVGLMREDDNRPTFLQQLGCVAFVVDYPERQARLLRHSILSPSEKQAVLQTGEETSKGTMATTLPLYTGLRRYGPNLHHYAVACDSITFHCQTKEASASAMTFSSHDMQRPIVVVVDTGLTGCILSQSWKEESEELASLLSSLSQEDVSNKRILGATLELGNNSHVHADADDEGDEHASTVITTKSLLNLTSNPMYWNLVCIPLPWFDSIHAHTHPHIVAAGATFLAQSKLTIDTVSQLICIEKCHDST